MLPFWLIRRVLTKMEARNQNPKNHHLGQNLERKMLSLGALWGRTQSVFKERNNLYFSSSRFTGKDKKVLKPNRENLLHILGEALDSEAREAIGKVVCGSCAVSTFDSPRDEITETSVRQRQWQPARRGNRRWNSILRRPEGPPSARGKRLNFQEIPWCCEQWQEVIGPIAHLNS